MCLLMGPGRVEAARSIKLEAGPFIIEQSRFILKE